MSLEYCNECGAQTGRAGRSDDSLYHSSEGPFCEDCFDSWAEKSIEKIDALRAENERLGREAKNDAIAYRAVIERQEELRAELAALRQPVADEREAFMDWGRSCGLTPAQLTVGEFAAWQARASLSAPAAGQDVSALVEALSTANWEGVSIGAKMLIKAAINALAARRQDPGAKS